MLNIQIKEIKTTQGRLKPQQRKQNKSKIIIKKKLQPITTALNQKKDQWIEVQNGTHGKMSVPLVKQMQAMLSMQIQCPVLPFYSLAKL